jgi:hypothetical protein
MNVKSSNVLLHKRISLKLEHVCWIVNVSYALVGKLSDSLLI